jgi:ATP-dependent RNA helicase DeaD
LIGFAGCPAFLSIVLLKEFFQLLSVIALKTCITLNSGFSMSDNTPTTFSELNLLPEILQVIDEVGYEVPSPIQAESIPPLLEGRDLLGQAQTGTGKTAAFALPLLSRLDLKLQRPQMLVLAPTRELAIQVAEALQTYARHLPHFHVLPVYGGQSMSIQLRQLSRGVHVVVGTPGRLLDHLKRGTLKLNNLKSLVLDEADEMLRMGFIDDVEEILNHAPDERQIALFSATMPDVIRRVARKYLHNPVEISIKTKTSTVSTIKQSYWQVSGLHKLDALTRILEVADFDAMLIFVRTKISTTDLAEKLEARGYSSSPLNGDMNQSLREQTIERLKSGSLDIVVATDVAARGLDVGRISHVLNYDIPYDTEAYVHRIGRTGRAGRTGEAILFVSPRERRMLRSIERATRQPIEEMHLPTREAVTNKRIELFKNNLTETLSSQDLDFFQTLVEDYQKEHETDLAQITAALAFMVQRERPLILKEKEQRRPERRDSRDNGRNERGDKRFNSRDSRGDGRRQGQRHERGGERGGRDNPRELEEGMMRYRIAVGREHGAMPKNIVGAIANEAGIDNRQIGHIKLHDQFSTVDLPNNLPNDLLKHLEKVWVCGQQLRISASKGNEESGNSKPRYRDENRGNDNRGNDNRGNDNRSNESRGDSRGNGNVKKKYTNPKHSARRGAPGQHKKRSDNFKPKDSE